MINNQTGMYALKILHKFLIFFLQTQSLELKVKT